MPESEAGGVRRGWLYEDHPRRKLLLDSGASKATQDKYRGVCENASPPLVALPEGLLHEATGKPGVAMAILKGGFANQVTQMMKPTNTVKHSGGASVE